MPTTRFLPWRAYTEYVFLPFSVRAKRLRLVSKTPARCGAQFSHHLPHHSAKSRRLALQREFFVISIYNMSHHVSHSLLVNENCHPHSPSPPRSHLAHTSHSHSLGTHLLTNPLNSTCDSLRCFITSVSIAVPAFLTHRCRKIRPDTF